MKFGTIGRSQLLKIKDLEDKMNTVFKISVCLLIIILSCVFCNAESVTKTVTAENQWTEAIYPNLMSEEHRLNDFIAARSELGMLTVCVTGGAWEGTVTLQAAFDFGTTFVDIGETFTSNTMKAIYCCEPGVSFRLGVDTGDFTSGPIYLRLSK
jgi:hypothetical protein